jgi:preprotein translocase YajC subunit
MNDAELISAVVVAVAAAFYFMFMRPIQKEQARHKKEIRDLRPGDEVITTSNFVARVKGIEVGEDGQTRIYLELANGVVFTALPGAILRAATPSPRPASEERSPEGGASG